MAADTPKPTKLAALAAARKRKEEEKKAQLEDDQQKGCDSESTDMSITLLDRLSEKFKTSSNIDSEKLSHNQEVDAETLSSFGSSQARRYRSNQRKDQSAEQIKGCDDSITSNCEEGKKDTSKINQELRALPSTFATIAVGGNEVGCYSSRRSRGSNTMTIPIANSTKPGSCTDKRSRESKIESKSESKSAVKSEFSQNELTTATNALSLGGTPHAKSKHLNVIQEFEKQNKKQAASFVVIGHVDHGKSTLMGRLLQDLRIVNDRTMDKLKREANAIGKSSFALAWVMDQTAEERERGVTVDIATNYFETEKTRFTILDAPGHRDFIPNMIAGASQADFAVLVIDASTNSFESGLKGQTKEHALLVRSLGVQRVVVAVNKMDNISWSQNRFEEIQRQMRAFLLAAGFQTKNLAFIPCAGLTGQNVLVPVSPTMAPWYEGRTLVKELDASEPVKRLLSEPLRFTISDTFRGSNQNPLSIAGRLDAGNIQVGERILVMPSGETAYVRAIEADNEPLEFAVAGQIATLHLTDIDPVHLRLGDVVCKPNSNPITNIASFSIKILAFEHVMPMRVDIHRGRVHAPGKIAKLLAVLDKSSGEVMKKKPKVVQPGAVAEVTIELETAIPLEVSNRVVLRSGGQTVAAGLIEKTDQVA